MQDPSGESHTVAGIVKEFIPYEKLSYTWKWASPYAVETLVTFFFKDKGDETEVFLSHENFKTEEAKNLHNQGWDACFVNLDKLYQ